MKKKPSYKIDISSLIGLCYGDYTIINAERRCINGRNRIWVLAKCTCGSSEWKVYDTVKTYNKCICHKKKGRVSKIDRDALIGRVYENVTVIDTRNEKSGLEVYIECTCGNKKWITYSNFINGNNRSCGCMKSILISKSSIKHNESTSRLYRIHRGMLDRCYRTSSKNYKKYGAKGITICDEWKNSYIAFSKWAHENGYADDLSIDRIDNSKGYYPDNCRWATDIQQARNTTRTRLETLNNETRPLPEWCEVYKIDYAIVTSRLHLGWSVEEALSRPVIRRNRGVSHD